MVVRLFSAPDRTETRSGAYPFYWMQAIASPDRLSWSRGPVDMVSKIRPFPDAAYACAHTGTGAGAYPDIYTETDGPFGSAMTPDELDEHDLARVANGDADALGELFDRHASIMMGVAYRVLGNRADAEDLVHDVFVEISRKATSYDASRSRVRSWILMRVRSRSIDRLRSVDVARRAKMIESSQGACTDSRPRSYPQEVDSDARRARRAVETLPPDQLNIVELAYFQGMSLSAIAREIRIPLGTVKSRLSAALKSLRSQLSKEPEPRSMQRTMEAK